MKTLVLSAKQKRSFGLSALVAILAGLAQAASASLVDVNFYSTGFSPPGSTASGAAVVGNAGDTWNGINAGSSGSLGSLVDTTGAATAVTLSYDTSGYGSITSVAQNTQPNPSLMNDYLYTHLGSSISVTLGNLAANTVYQLYVYVASNDGGNIGDRAANISANLVAGTATGDPQASFIAGENYVLLTPTSSATGTITITESDLSPPNGSGEVDMNGLQIEGSFPAPVPEPTTVIAGVLMLLPFGSSTLRILRKK